MTYPALVTLLLLVQYQVFGTLAGFARGKANITAPKMAGDEQFERRLRVQLNTLEQLIIVIPAMWICAHFFSANVASILGLVFFIGRCWYAIAYIDEPSKRAPGMIIGFLANLALILLGLYGIVF